MIEADSVHSTPPISSSSNQDTASNIVKFPVGVSRKEFLKTARSRRMSSCTVEPMDDLDEEDGAKEAGRDAIRASKRRTKEAAREANRPVTAINSDLRKERREVWRHAARVADYWRARLDWHSALSPAQSWGIEDSDNFPAADDDEEGRFKAYHRLLDTWRAAVVKQLLTPAPDLAAVTWKRAKVASSDFAYLPTKLERIERVIAEDLDWLAVHPTKRTGRPKPE